MSGTDRYKISLRVSHPSADAKSIGMELGLEPVFFYTAGDKKITPKGTAIPGIRKDSFWYCDIPSDGHQIEAVLERVKDLLTTKQMFLDRLLTTGGRLECFVGWFSCKANSGFILDHVVLGQLGNLGVDIAIDIYCENRDETKVDQLAQDQASLT
jgi:hypothetical protein